MVPKITFSEIPISNHQRSNLHDHIDFSVTCFNFPFLVFSFSFCLFDSSKVSSIHLSFLHAKLLPSCLLSKLSTSILGGHMSTCFWQRWDLLLGELDHPWLASGSPTRYMFHSRHTFTLPRAFPYPKQRFSSYASQASMHPGKF